MAGKTKKAPSRKPAKRKAKAAKPVKRATRKKAVRRKKAKKPESTIEKIENALLVGAADIDELALDMGLIGATPPPPRRKKRR